MVEIWRATICSPLSFDSHTAVLHLALFSSVFAHSDSNVAEAHSSVCAVYGPHRLGGGYVLIFRLSFLLWSSTCLTLSCLHLGYIPSVFLRSRCQLIDVGSRMRFNTSLLFRFIVYFDSFLFILCSY